jgi:hypothetical protein
MQGFEIYNQHIYSVSILNTVLIENKFNIVLELMMSYEQI